MSPQVEREFWDFGIIYPVERIITDYGLCEENLAKEHIASAHHTMLGFAGGMRSVWSHCWLKYEPGSLF